MKRFLLSVLILASLPTLAQHAQALL
ncbi:MAG: hypothetical protein ACI9CU_002346, partial [Polaribacter sp.]